MTHAPEPIGDPALSILFEPQATIKDIVSRPPRLSVMLLAMGMGAGELLQILLFDWGPVKSLQWYGIVGVALIAGPVAGIIYLYCGAVLLWLTGRWMGGKATLRELRAALAWSSVAYLAWLAVLFVCFLIFRTEYFRENAGMVYLFIGTVRVPLSVGGPAILLLMILKDVVFIWTPILMIRTLGAVQEFGVWRSIVNYGLYLILPVLAVHWVQLLLAGLPSPGQ